MSLYEWLMIVYPVLIVPLWNWNSGATVTYSSQNRSNRTFMELKCQSKVKATTKIKVLIVPLWNWNLELNAITDRAKCSNRTFMELKCQSANRRAGESIVLIVPLWNWNINAPNIYMYFNYVLIVPLWNWNMLSRLREYWTSSSNRTFMELKYLESAVYWCSF